MWLVAAVEKYSEKLVRLKTRPEPQSVLVT
jgi:hypothetical protein